MSDSDDTDILLLIPPDFFISEPNLKETVDYSLIEKIVQKENLSRINELDKVCNRSNFYEMDPKRNPLYLTPKSQSFSTKQFEYKCYEEKSPGGQSAFTVATSERQWDPINSTPKRDFKQPKFVAEPLSEIQKKNDGNILDEIDQYLGRHQYGTPKLKDSSKFYSSSELPSHYTPKASSTNPQFTSSSAIPKQTENSNSSKFSFKEKSQTDEVLTGLIGTKMSDWSLGLQQNSSVPNEALINLNKVWEAEDLGEPKSLDEERLRCRQYERTIQSLQSQLKQYQEKYSDAIKIDKTKNEALARLHDTNSKLVADMSQLESTLSRMELRAHREKDGIITENKELKSKIHQLEESNGFLERKLHTLFLSTSEVRDVHRKQLEEADIRLSNSKHNENILNNELFKTKSQLNSLQKDFDDQHKQLLAEKNKAEESAKELAALQKSIDAVREKEKTFSKELETQRSNLKSYYQSQLEDVVGEKLKEYQKQLDAVEELLRKEAKQNERQLAERAIKQIELITQKNEQEFVLLEEKHKQELQLYRIQLDNALRTISQLEDTLTAYNSKRNNIAERLHNVMETQWQKTLEIITNNDDVNNLKTSKSILNADLMKKNEFEQMLRKTLNNVENEAFETANLNRLRKIKNNDLNST